MTIGAAFLHKILMYPEFEGSIPHTPVLKVTFNSQPIRERGDNRLFIKQFPNVFLFVGVTTLETFNEF